MDSLAEVFVGKPLSALAVAAVLLAGGGVRRQLSSRGAWPRGLVLASLAWALYAAWEWLVRIETPEASIRVDLLILWPALGVLTALGIYRALRRRPPAR